jgi:DNA-binding NarL/FixJ family response regulator
MMTRSERRAPLLGMLFAGEMLKDIATALGISVRTVKADLSILYSEYGIEGRIKRVKLYHALKQRTSKANSASVSGG